MEEIRLPKPDDYENVNKAIDLIYNLIKLNPQIEAALWPPAIIYILAKAFIQCNFTHDDLLHEMNQAFTHYKSLFEENKDN